MGVELRAAHDVKTGLVEGLVEPRSRRQLGQLLGARGDVSEHQAGEVRLKWVGAIHDYLVLEVAGVPQRGSGHRPRRRQHDYPGVGGSLSHAPRAAVGPDGLQQFLGLVVARIGHAKENVVPRARPRQSQRAPNIASAKNADSHMTSRTLPPLLRSLDIALETVSHSGSLVPLHGSLIKKFQSQPKSSSRCKGDLQKDGPASRDLGRQVSLGDTACVSKRWVFLFQLCPKIAGRNPRVRVMFRFEAFSLWAVNCSDRPGMTALCCRRHWIFLRLRKDRAEVTYLIRASAGRLSAAVIGASTADSLPALSQPECTVARFVQCRSRNQQTSDGFPRPRLRRWRPSGPAVDAGRTRRLARPHGWAPRPLSPARLS
jgi:hypothetical protein